MTYTQHRDTQEVLAALDKLDIDFDESGLKDPEEVYRRLLMNCLRFTKCTLRFMNLPTESHHISGFGELSSQVQIEIQFQIFYISRQKMKIHL